jgi:hypothetical protein
MTVYVEISLVNGVVLEFTTVLLLYFLSVGFMVGRGHVGQVLPPPPPPPPPLIFHQPPFPCN